MKPRIFVGFGFGPIQAGLFLFEAWRSGRFDRLVVAEVDTDLVTALRRAGHRYGLNVAHADGIRTWTVDGVECLNPRDEVDRATLIAAIASAGEMATALPSVDTYGGGGPGSPAALIAAGLARKRADPGLPPAVIYAAENHNRAAEILDARIASCGVRPADARTQCVNTVIGKMSGAVGMDSTPGSRGLAPVTPDSRRAFLVEAFNSILVSRIDRPDIDRGLTMFEEKADLLPFEEAKLYGHNAAHAMLGCLLRLRGAAWMHEARRLPDVLSLVRDAFIEEAGAALVRRHTGLDTLFTPAGFRAYADDLVERMLNPHLADSVERVTRDLRRKLAWDDRFAGTVRLVEAEGLRPRRLLEGVCAAVRVLAAEEQRSPDDLLDQLWSDGPDDARRGLVAMVRSALRRADSGASQIVL